MLKLYRISYSPWSVKAKWALDHHKIKYRKINYQPLLGEPLLHWETGQWLKKVTVPLLVTDSKTIMNSWEIAKYAEQEGTGTPLFPKNKIAAILRFEEIADEISAIGRVLVTERIALDKGALKEMLPPFIPKLARGLMLPLAKTGVQFLRMKYQFPKHPLEYYEMEMKKRLLQLRKELVGKDYLCGEFSYADITVTVGLHFVVPLDQQYIRLGKNSRRCMTHPIFADEFKDLFSWRDTILTKHFIKT